MLKVVIYNTAIQCLNANPERSVFVGDGGSDELKGARMAGMKTILSVCLTDMNEATIKSFRENTDYYIKNYSEILSIVE